MFGQKYRVLPLVNGRPLTLAEVLSGIPQGSVLGPILFVILINNLPEMVASTAKIFADDTKVTKLFHNITSEEDHHKIQTNLDILVKWSEE